MSMPERFLFRLLIPQVFWIAVLHAQVSTGLPFLRELPSPVASGMGTVHSLFAADDPLFLTHNPAILGLLPCRTIGGSALLRDVRVSPVDDAIVLSSAAGWGGLSLDPYVGMPLTVGLGYSRTRLDYGRFVATGAGGPDPIGFFDAYDVWEGYSVGFGVHLPVEIAGGITLKRIRSRLAAIPAGTSFQTVEASITATDLGIVARAPLLEHICSLTGTTPVIALGIRPVLSVGVSAVRRNTAGEISYIDPAQADPVPRTAELGVGAEGGFVTTIDDEEWRILVVAAGRQAVDGLVQSRDTLGRTTYKSGFGDLEFFPNLFGGSRGTSVGLAEGGEIGLLEFLYLRHGEANDEWSELTSSGFSIRWRGLWKLAKFLFGRDATHSFVAPIAERLDVEYHNATQSRTTVYGSEMERKYSGISVAVRW